VCLQVIVLLIYTSNLGHRGCMESVQQDTNMKCGLLECPAFGTCEIWARTEGIIETLSTIATRRGTGRLCQLCWGAQCMCTIVAVLMEML